jgi:hypothetical protein
MTAKEIEKKVGELWEDTSDWGYGDPYYTMWGEECDIELSDGTKLEFVDSFGGEGNGDTMWVVFAVGEQFFRVNGYYSSWGDSEFDGSVEEVKQVQVMRTEWESVNG